MYVRVYVKTEQRKESVKETGPDRLEISVREKPVRGKANGRVLELLTTHFKNPAGGVKIISGHHSQTKLIKVAQ